MRTHSIRSAKVCLATACRHLACLVLLVLTGWALGAEPDRVDLVILHINDTHGHTAPFKDKSGVTVGGYARVRTLVEDVRSANPGRVLFLHAGDDLSKADAVTIHTGGDTNVRAWAAMRVDAWTPGNGDFYFGLDNLLRLAAQAPFPTLHANVTRADGGPTPFQASVVRTVNGIRIGILGLGCIRLEHPASAALKQRDPIAVAAELVPALRPQVDLLVALTHIGFDSDKKLAAAVSGIDLIVGGHSHTVLQEGTRVPRPDGTGEVLIVQAGEFGQSLGRVDLRLARTGATVAVAAVTAQLISVRDTVAEHAETATLLDAVRKSLTAPLFTADVALPHPESGPTPMGDFAVRAILDATHADLAILDRTAICDGIAPGPGTLADVYRIAPWRNQVLTISLPGSALPKLMALPKTVFAGCEFRQTAPDAPPEVRVRGKPLTPDATYTVAAGNFLVWAVPQLRALPWKDSGQRVDTILAAHLAKLGKITGP